MSCRNYSDETNNQVDKTTGKKVKGFLKNKRPGLILALLSSFEWHQERYSPLGHYLPDFFGVDTPRELETEGSKKKRIYSKEVAEHIVSVLDVQGFDVSGNEQVETFVSRSIMKLKPKMQKKQSPAKGKQGKNKREP